ncbi:MAG: nucleotidyltransferase family protein [Ignavibacteria bacterium]|jgi:molybdenum cofactor cytidylyltransferase|nr:nucleotidyltransferase family protein [Ignavibacteria bacterium]MCU7520396.1 nucleotidyltransferase family protein [Ignavibacteria bacterium]
MVSGANKNKLSGVILAAGFSSRMNAWKMELNIKGRPLLYYTIRPMLEVCSEVIIVGGYSIEKLSELIDQISRTLGPEKGKIRLVKNEDFRKGMFSSVKKGLQEVNDICDGIFIMPGDMPFVRLDTYKKLSALLSSENENDILFPTALINTEDGGTRWKKGHPVLLSGRVKDLIIKNDNDAVFRDVLRPFSFELCPVEDKGICFDIDDETDLEKALSYLDNSYKYS